MDDGRPHHGLGTTAPGRRPTSLRGLVNAQLGWTLRGPLGGGVTRWWSCVRVVMLRASTASQSPFAVDAVGAGAGTGAGPAVPGADTVLGAPAQDGAVGDVQVVGDAGVAGAGGRP